jgi:hypothetical protein
MKNHLTIRRVSHDIIHEMNDTEVINKPFVTKEFADRLASIRKQYGSFTAYFAGRHGLPKKKKPSQHSKSKNVCHEEAVVQ